MTRRLALAAGGTGGHMFPAEALAEEAKKRGWSVLLLTDDRGMRYAKSFPADQTAILKAANPNVRGPLAKLSMASAMGQGVMAARRALTAFKADMVVGFGGYPSAPGLFAASSLKVPYGVHEQNAVLGRVNRRAAPSARFVAHGFARLDRLPKIKGKLVQTGNPVRQAVQDAAGIPYVPPSEADKIRVLIFGGSQGASLFGRVFPQALASFPSPLRERLEVTHQVSETDHDAVSQAYAAAGITAELAPFFVDLPRRIAQSHFVMARSGASTVTELSVIGRPSLLVPLGIAMDDHQRANAEVLVEAGAADILLEGKATPEAAAALLLPRLSAGSDLGNRAAAARGKVPANAAATLADLIDALLEQRA
ncbi:UDP-N-acetylglucosamine--N-acetylmuramyl-(pentapeptide) pyrophosphoryl-undecaprenol N-acetylglucosamine transferase [Parvularcula sp. LCG005]|uniref:UDP-N-acetylglucosamine--N-acetylmuramyl- (pentapeptide) pyrophosphoryl-undecaprenol N-acetylglucosamine transferase n=1 Tax=Parvularcula sp. LCG005 TaxID=3078805 RepID=UPI0029425F9A|nr:UDP-N-acetylglucosamine--N-acetylmuramyl-(pentapeptide) pyrophosphoryl-undecaprenol N-acetylglucosamine transferase [Parvularcula sp. LCG005]WOI52123.1 UDP-N-acetylglucosamine--N-acetylmuramyl-(pentapeptide) pyrophosphoryl-undecaprenol N-acetylglucosamine transferase [Parvularcula sp. LCG005]